MGKGQGERGCRNDTQYGPRGYKQAGKETGGQSSGRTPGVAMHITSRLPRRTRLVRRTWRRDTFGCGPPDRRRFICVRSHRLAPLVSPSEGECGGNFRGRKWRQPNRLAISAENSREISLRAS